MKSPAELVAVVERRLRDRWHTWITTNNDHEWPWRVPLGAPTGRGLEASFAAHQDEIVAIRRFAATAGIEVVDVTRRVHGTSQPVPTHAVITDVDHAAAVAAGDWPARLERARCRHAELVRLYPDNPDLARVVRAVVDWDPVAYDLFKAVVDWFLHNDAAGLTPRQVPVPGVHAKWLNTHQGLVEMLVRKPLGLAPAHPARLHFTYLDPDHIAAGGRLHDSVSIGDTGARPAYRPTVVVISENKDTAINFPHVTGGVAVEGNGNGGAAAAAVDWIREAPVLIYWGDIDRRGFEIVNAYRAAGAPITTILMDTDTYDTYDAFGTSLNPDGTPIVAAPAKPLPHLTEAERVMYQRLCDPDHDGPRRLEQERIPLPVAAHAAAAVTPRT